MFFRATNKTVKKCGSWTGVWVPFKIMDKYSAFIYANI